jgi:hypothetical protein
MREVNGLSKTGIEEKLDAVTRNVSGFDNLRQNCHGFLFQRRDLAKRLKCLQLFPVRSKFMFVKPCPFSNETSCPRGAEFPRKELPSKIERRQLPLVLNVKMRWFVIVEEHWLTEISAYFT